MYPWARYAQSTGLYPTVKKMGKAYNACLKPKLKHQDEMEQGHSAASLIVFGHWSDIIPTTGTPDLNLKRGNGTMTSRGPNSVVTRDLPRKADIIKTVHRPKQPRLTEGQGVTFRVVEDVERKACQLESGLGTKSTCYRAVCIRGLTTKEMGIIFYNLNCGH